MGAKIVVEKKKEKLSYTDFNILTYLLTKTYFILLTYGGCGGLDMYKLFLSRYLKFVFFSILHSCKVFDKNLFVKMY